MKFMFPVVLGGAEKSSDLILVADTVDTSDVEILRQVRGVARALDVVKSSNPLTTVIVGPRPNQYLLNDMMTVCRVLPIGLLDENEVALRNWLAVLTPLDQIDADGIVADPIDELRHRAAGLPDEVTGLLELQGAGKVEDAVNLLLTKELEKAWEPNE